MTLASPDPPSLPAVQALCELDQPYAFGPDQDGLFVRAMGEIVAWHRQRCPAYATMLGDFCERSLKSVADCALIPFVSANFFKVHELLSIPQEQVSAHITSSGTSGQKTQMFFDDWSLGAPQRMIDSIFRHYGWWSEDSTNYLLFSYESEPDTELGTAYTDHFLCKYAPVAGLFVALRRDGKQGHEFDLFGAMSQLQAFAAEGLPVRILGFPSFLWFTLQRMRDLGVPALRLHPDSLIFVSGGWKGYADQSISKSELVAACVHQLGMDPERVRDGYGSVEHCIPYIDGPDHRLRIPVWSRVFARHPETLQVLPPGQPGLLHFVSPYITSVPAHSLLTGDLASVYPDHFEVHGRAGHIKNRSCALAAAELLKGRT